MNHSLSHRQLKVLCLSIPSHSDGLSVCLKRYSPSQFLQDCSGLDGSFPWQAVEKFFHRQWNRIQRDPFGPLFPSRMTGPVRCRWCVCQKPLRRAARHPFKIALSVADSVIHAFIGLLLMTWSSQCQFGETQHCLRNDGRQRVSAGSPFQPVRRFTKLSYYIFLFIWFLDEQTLKCLLCSSRHAVRCFCTSTDRRNSAKLLLESSLTKIMMWISKKNKNTWHTEILGKKSLF